MTIHRVLCLAVFTLMLGGCGLIYKQNIQQGNAIEQDDLDELYIGMNQRQVLFVLGTPSVMDPFNQDRWDYVQTFSRRGNEPVMRTVTLRFEDGMLAQIIGQDDPFAPTSSNDDPDEVASFIKQPESDSSADGASPQDASMQSAEEEILQGTDPDIETISERTAEDREYKRQQEMLDQTPEGDLSTPDIDG